MSWYEWSKFTVFKLLFLFCGDCSDKMLLIRKRNGRRGLRTQSVSLHDYPQRSHRIHDLGGPERQDWLTGMNFNVSKVFVDAAANGDMDAICEILNGPSSDSLNLDDRLVLPFSLG